MIAQTNRDYIFILAWEPGAAQITHSHSYSRRLPALFTRQKKEITALYISI